MYSNFCMATLHLILFQNCGLTVTIKSIWHCYGMLWPASGILILRQGKKHDSLGAIWLRAAARFEYKTIIIECCSVNPGRSSSCPCSCCLITTFTPPPIGERSIVMTVSVCLCVCLSVYLRNFKSDLRQYLCLLHADTARFSSICWVLLVLWMASHLPIMSRHIATRKQRALQVNLQVAATGAESAVYTTLLTLSGFHGQQSKRTSEFLSKME